ncbi:hypothetical protein [Actinocorallia sp. A-T 12471]|uniref:hypothetical protein n=1 Tax=Actinocorallia sp. A-T 12471 TaxID=3089813 RepID=UPI0029CCCAA8|nr:hypothetical protein [Actinocorallia sp. A-T 12471]MDX6743811.1 hypothetical protein [Actinocorallia sp. A-T 12471]
MPTLSDYLYSGIYRRSCRFGNIERFVELVGTRADLTRDCGAEAARQQLRALAEGFRASTPIEDEQDALGELVAADLASVAEAGFDDIEAAGTTEQRLAAAGPAIQRKLVSAGVPVEDSPLRVLEEFPPPFNQFGWSAFAPDREDEENFGIEPGVYFLRDRLRPLYSELLFAHEVIHTVTGKKDPEVFAMGLEEGIAEVVGSCFGSLAVLEPSVIKNALVYGRHGVDRPKLWSVYLDHTRQVYLLYQEFGLAGLAALIREGRTAIHRAEELVLRGRYKELKLPRGNWDPDTGAILEFVCCGYLPSHVFSPIECLLASHAEAGRSLSEVCERANVAPAVGRPALESLAAKSALFVRDGDRIGYSNVARYRAVEESGPVKVMRYHLP